MQNWFGLAKQLFGDTLPKEMYLEAAKFLSQTLERHGHAQQGSLGE